MNISEAQVKLAALEKEFEQLSAHYIRAGEMPFSFNERKDIRLKIKSTNLQIKDLSDEIAALKR